MKKQQHQPSAQSQLQIAIQHHQAGRLQQAEAIYKAMPNNPDALNLQGVIAYQTGNNEKAAEFMKRAIRGNPSNATYYYNLGLAYRAMNKLGDAENWYRKAIARQHDYIDAYNNLGVVLYDLDKLDEAIACYHKVLALKPDHVQTHVNLGAALRKQGKRDEAVACYRHAIALNPGYAEGHSNLAAVLKEQGKFEESVACSKRALELNPDSVEAHNNLGNALEELGELDEALTCYRRALAIRSDWSESHFNLGSLLRIKGDTEEAIDCFKRALQIAPDFAEASNSLGIALMSTGRLDEAIACFERALQIKPDYANACNNIGIALLNQGKLDEAIATYRKALEIKPDLANAHSNVLFSHNYHSKLSAEQIFDVYRQWNDEQAARFSANLAPFTNNHDPARRLRVGYVSADFNSHSVIHFAAPLIEQHDKSRVEVFCYYNRFHYDINTVRIMAVTDHWVPCLTMSDDELAQRIRDDGIDVLVDLAGHTEGNRLLVFARKPAPVQISWMGFGYTTGLSAMDYFIGDPAFTPPGCEHLFSETVYRLPHTTWAYRPPTAAPEPGPLPARQRGHVTFACVSTTTRFNDGLIEAWAAILRRLPDSRLRLDNRNFSDAVLRQRFIDKFARLGVPETQLEIGFTSPVWSIYQNVDIVLDCFPHNSGTTTFEALWMGLPVVTLADRPSVGRFGASILNSIGHPEWIATDRDDYINRAVALAQDLSGLEQARATLRDAMRSSPLLDYPAFARDMENAYCDMWQAWCAKQPRVAYSLQTAVELHQAGRLQEAESIYLKMQDNADALHLLGVVCMQTGRNEQAAKLIMSAIQSNPENASYHCNLGSAYQALNKFDDAVASFQRAISLNPGFALAHNNLGNTLKNLGRADEAIASISKAIELKPDYVEAYSNLGSIFNNLGRYDEAVTSFQRAIAIKPDFAEAHFNLGNAFKAQAKLDEAISSYQTTLGYRPDFYQAHNNFGVVLKDQGMLDEAIICFQNSLSIKRDFVNANSNLLFCLNYLPYLSAEQIFDVYRQWNDKQAARFSANLQPFANRPDPARRLRVGYVSADFNCHSVIRFAAPLIEQHDKSQVEVFCYYNQTAYDDCTRSLMAVADHWIPCLTMSDDELAQRIRDDGIDILVDLAGHTLGHRLMVFARKPAPVQISWLGFGYTTGLSAMDYFIGDPAFTPPGCEHLFSETVYRLPHTTWAYRPPTAAPEPGPLPARQRGHVTFCCVSTATRFNDGLIEAWAAILRRLPGARLRLDHRNFSDAVLRQRFIDKFARLGVPASSLEIGFTSPVWSIYQNVDIVLDCFPHNSGTTTFEALWMGLPVVTLADRPSVGRFGDSILNSIGHPEWIATDRDDYINRAVALAQDLPGLEQARSTLRDAMRSSPLLDYPAFARDMENAYRDMWQAWCAKQQKEIRQS